MLLSLVTRAAGGRSSFIFTASLLVISWLSTQSFCAEAPKITAPKTVLAKEDQGILETSLKVSDADSELTAVTLTGTSDNELLVPNNKVTFSGTGADRILKLEPLANAFGNATITVTVSDGVNSSTTTVILKVAAINDAPSFNLNKEIVTVAEDAGLTTENGFAKDIVTGPPNEETQKVTFTLTPTNKTFYKKAPKIDAAGVLTFETAQDVTGEDQVTVAMKDSGGTTGGGVNEAPAKNFKIVVTGVNDAPTLTLAKSASGNEDSGPIEVPFKVSDPDTQLTSVTVSGTSDNELLVPNNKVTVTGTEGDRILKLEPLADAFGTATITVTASDGTASSTATLVLKVSPVNDAPSFDLAESTIPMTEDFGLKTIESFARNIQTGPTNEATQKVTFTLTPTDKAFYKKAPKIDSAGTLTFETALDKTGSDLVTVAMKDSGGTSSGGVSEAPTKTFTIVVTGANDAPVITLAKSASANEDGGPIEVPFKVSDADSQLTAVTLSGTSDNDQLVPNNKVTISGTGADRILKLEPLADAFGTATITVTASDGAATSTATLALKVSAVNDAPSFELAETSIPMAEDAGLKTIEEFAKNIQTGPPNEASQKVTFTLTPTDKTFYKKAPRIDSAGTLTFETALDRTGSDLVTVAMKDSGGTSGGGVSDAPAKTFTIVVTGANDAPVITLPKSASGNEDGGPIEVPFKVSDPDSELTSVTLGATSDNDQLVPNNKVTISGTGADRILKLEPLADAFGTATITVTASDGTASSTTTLSLKVSAINDAPSFDLAETSIPMAEDAGLKTIAEFAKNIQLGPANEASQKVTFTLTPTDKAFYKKAPKIDAAGTLTFETALDKTGSDLVTVAMKDSGGTNAGGVNEAPTKTFTIVVTGANDAPVITLAKSASANEDGGPIEVPFKVSDPDSELTAVTLSGTSDNDQLVPNNKVTISGAGADRILKLEPLADAFGTATITVTASDGTASSTATLALKVSAINDAPSFDLAESSVPMTEDFGLKTIETFARNIKTGPANEASQKVTFTLTPTDKAFYKKAPKIDAAGTLTFETALDKTGSDLVTVAMKDSGGTSGGGVSDAPTKTFTIVVTGANDAPVITLAKSASANEDGGPIEVPFQVSDPDSELTGVTLSATSDNQFLVPNNKVTITGNGAERILKLEPLADAFGTATITVTASDGNASGTATLALKVAAVNDAPNFTLSQTDITATTGLVTIKPFATQISTGPTNEASQKVNFVVTTENKSYYKRAPKIDAEGTLTFETAASVTGSDQLKVVLKDSGGTSGGGVNQSTEKTFTIRAPVSGSTVAQKKDQPGAQRRVTVRMASTAEPLPNPYRGLITHVRDFVADPAIPQSLAYADVTWAELEPARGELQWEALESQWNQHLALGRKVGIRLTLADPWYGAAADIPRWLAEAGVELRPYEVNESKGLAPDWDNPVLLTEHDRLIAMLGERYDQDTRVAWVEAGSYGIWGEWHLFGNDYAAARNPSKQRLLEAYVRAFPNKALLLPFGDDFASAYFAGAGGGLRNGFVGSADDNQWFLRTLDQLRPALHPDYFKRALAAGEFGNGDLGLAEALSERFEENLQFIADSRLSWIGPVSASWLRPSEGMRPKVEAVERTLGYRFAVTELSHESNVAPGQKVVLTVRVRNDGIAPFYYAWPVEVSLIGASMGQAFAIKPADMSPAWDIRQWLPGTHDLSVEIELPPKLAPDSYEIALAILDPATGLPGIRLANHGRDEQGRYRLSSIEVFE